MGSKEKATPGLPMIFPKTNATIILNVVIRHSETSFRAMLLRGLQRALRCRIRSWETGLSVYLDFKDAIKSKEKKAIENKYGNLFELYYKITGDNPYEVPMRIYPAGHYTMGGLWVDYNLMTTIEGLYAIGEANFSDHGANRLGGLAH